ncbi:DrmB family protein [Agromyces sp. NPDC055661]
MARNDKVIRTIRLSETVSPFGPGALVDILGESFMAMTGDEWPPASVRTSVSCDRLASKLRVDELWAAPSSGEPDGPKTPGLEFARFPAWLFCQECRRMTRWTRMMETGSTPTCPDCEGRLVPMRFVTVCATKSHADDVPWPDWVHRAGSAACDRKDRLRFHPSKGAREGLSALEVSCDACKTSRSLGDLRGDVLARDGFTCRGKQPWQREWGNCGKPLEVLQRGATSLYFGEVVSAIDIPEVEGREAELDEQIRKHPYWHAVQAGNAAILDMMVDELAAVLEPSADVIRRRILALTSDEPTLQDTKRSLLSEEFEAFVAAIAGSAPVEDFVTRVERRSEQTPAGLGDVVLVDRLREVRASIGFRRYTPEAHLVPSVPKSPMERSWYPAVEGYGEGIFITFDSAAVDAWAAQDGVQRRADRIASNQDGSMLGSRLHETSPQFLLLHAFAHAIMRELAFVSGYSAPSLRERIYCEGAGDYGVFIYTTSTDVEGTLGGLARQGEADYLNGVVLRSLEQVAWCANDPVCSESDPQSIDGLNLAACHACLLAPETSCESFNLLLDRAMLVGGDGFEGYFQKAIESALDVSVTAMS